MPITRWGRPRRPHPPPSSRPGPRTERSAHAKPRRRGRLRDHARELAALRGLARGPQRRLQRLHHSPPGLSGGGRPCHDERAARLSDDSWGSERWVLGTVLGIDPLRKPANEGGTRSCTTSRSCCRLSVQEDVRAQPLRLQSSSTPSSYAACCCPRCSSSWAAGPGPSQDRWVASCRGWRPSRPPIRRLGGKYRTGGDRPHAALMEGP
jgi:hypothetical protein